MCLSRVTKFDYIDRDEPIIAYKVVMLRFDGTLDAPVRNITGNWEMFSECCAEPKHIFTLHGESYQTGFHAFRTKRAAKKFLKKQTKDRPLGWPKFYLAQVLLYGNVNFGWQRIGALFPRRAISAGRMRIIRIYR